MSSILDVDDSNNQETVLTARWFNPELFGLALLEAGRYEKTISEMRDFRQRAGRSVLAVAVMIYYPHVTFKKDGKKIKGDGRQVAIPSLS